MKLSKAVAVTKAVEALERGFQQWATGLFVTGMNATSEPFISPEEREALADGTQWPFMLLDYEARIGIAPAYIQEARTWLVSFMPESLEEIEERIAELETAIVALPDDAREEYIKAVLELEELQAATVALCEQAHISKWLGGLTPT